MKFQINHISTHNDSCECEEEEMDHTGIQYRSNIARKLQQSEAISNVQPVTNYNSERPRQTESSTIHHIPQESISRTQPPSLQCNQQPVTNYNSERPRQTESSTVYHIPLESMTHTQPAAIQCTKQKTMHHIPQQSISHTQPTG